MKRYAFILHLCATLCLAGCLSTEVSKSEVCGVEHIMTRDYGWKFFNWIPVFRSDITLDRVQKALTEEAARRGKTATNLTWHNTTNIMLDVPILYITIPIPYIFCYHEVQLSGELQ